MKVILNGADVTYPVVQAVVETQDGMHTVSGDDMVLSIVSDRMVYLIKELSKDTKKLWQIETLIPWDRVTLFTLTPGPALSDNDWSELQEGINLPLKYEEASPPGKPGNVVN